MGSEELTRSPSGYLIIIFIITVDITCGDSLLDDLQCKVQVQSFHDAEFDEDELA